MSKLETTLLTRILGHRARLGLIALCGALAVLAAPMAQAEEAPGFTPLHSLPATLAELDVRRHVPGASRVEDFAVDGFESGDSVGLYRQVSRNFKVGLRYTRALFSLAPAEARADDHYVFLNLVGML